MATYPPETESQSYFRLMSLIIDNGTAVLRKLLIKYVLAQSASLDEYLAKYATQLWRLESRRVLNDSQMDLMFPGNGAAADVDTFDITLISLLLNNICGKLPKHEKEEIEKLRNARNELCGHMPRASVEEGDFKVLWGTIRRIITNLAQYCSDPAFVRQMKDDIEELWNRPKLTPTFQLRALEIEQKNRHEIITHIDPERLRSSLMSTYADCYSCISVSPLFEKREIPLDKLFTDVVIIEEDETARRDKMNNGESRKFREIPVQSYKDVFYRKDKKEKVKSIYLLGEAGTGKTVYSQQMVNKWIKAHQTLKSQKIKSDIPKGHKMNTEATKPNESTESHTRDIDKEDTDTMAEFYFLFYVPLRYVKKTETLIEAVYRTIAAENDKVNKDTTEYIFENCPEKILIICDGLDEVDGYPSRHNFHSFTVVTTTRPWKYDEVRDNSPRTDRVLQLKGLGENGVPELAERLRSTCYQDQPISSVKHFLCEIQKLGLKTTLKETPLMLVYLLHVWYQKSNLSTSLTANMLDIIEYILQRGENKLKAKGDNLLLQQDFSLHQIELKGIVLGSACFKYGKLLMTAAEIAFKGLTNSSDEHTLVFSVASLNRIITTNPSYLDMCLKLGLFSKSEKLHILCIEQHISFPHKLFQELFMALHLINDKSAVTEFCNYCDTLVKVLEMSNVFIFTTVLCRETALRLSQHVVDICDSDSNVLRFRSTLLTTSGKLMGDLTKMYVKCVEEHIKVQSHICELYVSDIYVLSLSVSRSPANWDVLATLMKSNISRLKSFYLTSFSQIDSQNTVKTLELLTKATSLTYLHLDLMRSETLRKSTTYLDRILANNKHLHVLHLDCYLPLPFPKIQQNLHHLSIKHFRIFGVDSHQPSQGYQMFASRELRSMRLMEVQTYNYYLDISLLTNLNQLTLDNVTMSGSSWWSMVKAMNELLALQELVLIEPKANDEKRISRPSHDLHLTFLSRLHKLTLKATGLSTLLDKILCSIGEGCQLESLELVFSYPTRYYSLSSALTHLHLLKELKLGHISVHGLNLESNNNLEKLVLKGVSMSESAYTQLFTSFKSLNHLTELHIDTCSNKIITPADLYNIVTSFESLHRIVLELKDTKPQFTHTE